MDYNVSFKVLLGTKLLFVVMQSIFKIKVMKYHFEIYILQIFKILLETKIHSIQLQNTSASNYIMP